jgi:hypothetical protein
LWGDGRFAAGEDVVHAQTRTCHQATTLYKRSANMTTSRAIFGPGRSHVDDAASRMLDARETGEEVPALLGITSDRDSVIQAVERRSPRSLKC